METKSVYTINTDINILNDIWSSNYNPILPNEYVSKMYREVAEIPTFMSLINSIAEINFVVEYYKNGENSTYQNVMHLLERSKYPTSGMSKAMDMKELNKYNVSNDQKFVIIVDNLLFKAEQLGIEMGVYNQTPYMYDPKKGFWEQLSVDLVKSILSKVATRSGINSIDARSQKVVLNLYSQFEETSKIPAPKVKEGETRINLRNGTFVFGNGDPHLIPFDSADFFRYKLDFDFNPEAEAPMFMKFLNMVLPDKKSQMVLSEYIGYVFAKNLKLEKCLVLVGTGANGKSVFFDIVRALLGKTNVSSYTLSYLCGKEYYRAELEKVLLNYSSEMGGKGSDPDTVKQLISNEPIQARSPYGKPYQIDNYCRFMFNTNELPKVVEHSYGYLRRFSYVHFAVTIPKRNRDADLAKKINEKELSGVFNWVLEGLERLQTQKRFTESKRIEDLFDKVRTESCSVAMFVQDNEYVVPEPDQVKKVEHLKLSDLRKDYESYCKENGYYPVSTIELSRRLRDLGFRIKPKCTDNATWVFFTRLVSVPAKIEEPNNLITNYFKQFKNDQ